MPYLPDRGVAPPARTPAPREADSPWHVLAAQMDRIQADAQALAFFARAVASGSSVPATLFVSATAALPLSETMRSIFAAEDAWRSSLEQARAGLKEEAKELAGLALD